MSRCRLFVHVPKRKCNGEFEPQAEEGVFIGYDRENYYRVIDPQTGTVTTSQDLEFIEDPIPEISNTTELVRNDMPDVDYVTLNVAVEEDQERHTTDYDAVDSSEGQTIGATYQ